MIITKLVTILSALPLGINFSFKSANEVHIDTKLFDGIGNNKREDVLQNLQHENSIFHRHPFKELPVGVGYYIPLLIVFVIWTLTVKIIPKKSNRNE